MSPTLDLQPLALLSGSTTTRLLLLGLLCFGSVLLWVRRLNLSSMRKIPGPWYLKLTTAFVKYHEFAGTKRGWVHGLHLKYGPVVQLGRNEISFASYTAAKQIYSSGNKEFRKTELYSLFEQEGHINLFTALDPEKHSEIRRSLADRYSNSNVLRPKIMDAIADRAAVFAEVCAAGKSADVYLLLHAYALDCVTAMLFHPYGTNSLAGAEDKQMVRLLSYADARKALYLMHYFPFLSNTWYALASGSENSEKGGPMIRNYVHQTLARGGHSDFTLAARFLASPDFDRSLAESECLDHIGAGIETTGDTLCWLMWELSQPRHRGKVARLHEELLVGASDGRGLDTLPYLGAVVQEALRLWAPGTQPLPRYVPANGAYIDGSHIPGNTIVGCPSYSMHRIDERVFPEADEFNPDRWLSSDGNTDRQRLFFAFALGARTCIGKHLAMAEMRACLNAVYSKYWTQPAADMTSSMDMDDQVLTSRPRGMCCRITFVPWTEAGDDVEA
ncbi:hypothetical protein CMUS01_15621 [Colletotrichum musicola]|uniref:Cytochrome P450 n=1 Tax=Colletotrichum musicola TaxID=2175873 RepID=A0A8H6IUU6_9PEZI|nr:hypothetical protein CMUS01_15621 [Colletotrichum musicola]